MPFGTPNSGQKVQFARIIVGYFRFFWRRPQSSAQNARLISLASKKDWEKAHYSMCEMHFLTLVPNSIEKYWITKLLNNLEALGFNRWIPVLQITSFRSVLWILLLYVTNAYLSKNIEIWQRYALKLRRLRPIRRAPTIMVSSVFLVTIFLAHI